MGDETSRQILAFAGAHIGIALGDLVNLLNPSLVILGGEVTRKAKDLLTDALAKTLQRRALRASWRSLEIHYAQLAEKAIPLGGVALVTEERMQKYFLQTIQR